MKVILREDIPRLGKVGQTVEVKGGYGRNFLLPRNLAVPATKANLQAISEIEKQHEIREKKRRRSAEKVKDHIEKLSLSVEVLVGEEEKLFGSVTNADITRLLEEQGVQVDKRMIQLDEPIKALGVYTVPVKVEKEVVANLKLFVVKKPQA
ncbi:MAG: 50S ribosomal protein L9 [candidate division Zixibacteria bacterium]|jgi:large subunit ribosomal protein L9|nr:50S ribosomal protein L9 [candidate division Zixibacteria bacterium]